jgi:hypothetical protein
MRSDEIYPIERDKGIRFASMDNWNYEPWEHIFNSLEGASVAKRY